MTSTRVGRGWTVVHTRGEGVRSIAGLLAAHEPSPVGGDLRLSLLEARAEMMVARHLASGDLVKQVVPHHVSVAEVKSVVGAIGTGPHGSLVAEVTARLAAVLGIPGLLLAASPGGEWDRAIETALIRAGRLAPGVDRSLIRVSPIRDLNRELPAGSLLVLGAPGGSWLQRQFFGPGRRLAGGAPAGALVVRDAPARCFQAAAESSAFGTEMRVVEALRLLDRPAAPVAKNGLLVGMVRRAALLQADPVSTIGAVMEAPICIAWDAPVAAAAEAGSALQGAPLPVVGPNGELLGSIMKPVESPDAVASNRPRSAG